MSRELVGVVEHSYTREDGTLQGLARFIALSGRRRNSGGYGGFCQHVHRCSQWQLRLDNQVIGEVLRMVSTQYCHRSVEPIKIVYWLVARLPSARTIVNMKRFPIWTRGRRVTVTGKLFQRVSLDFARLG